METLKAIKTRRSIRNYTDDNIDAKKIELLLEAAMMAPSAFDKRSWQFLVLNESKILKGLITAIPHAEMLEKAAAAILVCGDKNLEESNGLMIQNCSAAIQNILLAAHDINLGAVWVGIYPFEEIVMNTQKFFKLPDSVLPVALVVLGYPAESHESISRYDSTKVHYNKW